MELNNFLPLYGLLLLLGFCIGPAAAGYSKTWVDIDLEEATAIQCGGTIEADSNSLEYPGPDGFLTPGEVCVWTIHLETTRDFRFTFANLDIGSNFSNCENGGVRIYSLTNLAPTVDSYTFCNRRPPPETFFLGENVAVIVFYAGEGVTFPTPNNGSGFSLSWQGRAYDQFTKHISSFSSAPNGIIRYPVIGQYDADIAATWLIKSPSTPTFDIAINSIDLENCTNPDPCSCDALILYEVSSSGILNETRRFCGESSNAFLDSTNSRFIVAFFSDFNLQPVGNGFDLIYYPSLNTTPSTSTTTQASTTPGFSTLPPSGSDCGQVLRGKAGTISYLPNSWYSYNLRCMWIIQVEDYDSRAMVFQLAQSGIVTGKDDGISLTTLSFLPTSSFVILDSAVIKSTTDLPRPLLGQVAIVNFFSDDYSGSSGNGFILNYAGLDRYPNPGNVSSKSVNFIAPTGNDNSPGRLSHPENGGLYSADEISTFLFPPGLNKNIYCDTFIQYRLKSLDTNCNDVLSVFIYDPEGYTWDYQARLCEQQTFQLRSKEPILFVFRSTVDSPGAEGFSFDWAFDCASELE